MLPTIKFIQERFDYFNGLCFDGKLPIPRIGLNNRATSAGLTHYKKKRNLFGKTKFYDIWIEISTRLDLPQEEFDKTIVHEMIHYYILHNNLHDDSPHGRIFRAKMKELNDKYGLNIGIRFNASDELMIRTVTTTRYVFVGELKEGSVGMTVVAKSRIFEIWDFFEKSDMFVSRRWYASNRAIFQKYPAAQKPKLYHIDAGKMQDYLTGAVELERNGDIIQRKTF